MRAVVCTLFEGSYHFGVAAFINSLHYKGYQGEIYIGYRGVLPRWASKSKENPIENFSNNRTLQVTDNLQIHFILLDTHHHLTNYKPDFMLRIWEGPAKESESIFYFDPDIILAAPWKFIQDWANHGVAMCEDVNSPLSKYHPRRMAWREYFKQRGINLSFKEQYYANGGFVGVVRHNRSFLLMWKTIQEEMALIIGGLNRSSISGDPLPDGVKEIFAPFSKTDQDALNATIEAWEGRVSFLGKEGMAFNSGITVMPHALGSLKPWLINPLIQALFGRSPRKVDRYFWNSVSGPIFPYSPIRVYLNQIFIKMASFIGRWYQRSEL